MNCTGLYLRSAIINDKSIELQKEMLEKWCKENGITNTEIYSDNGYSGLQFNRPSFQKLLYDIDSGKINMVITTDLSRIGRDIKLTNEYLNLITSKVRYIAVKNGIDSSLQSSVIEDIIKISATSGRGKKNG